MAKIFTFTIAMILIVIVVATTLMSLDFTFEENIHAVSGVITNIDKEYLYATTSGGDWVLDFEKNYSIGDNIIIIYDDKNTADIYDDEIISIEKNH